MEYLFNIIMHLDNNLVNFVAHYGAAAYVLLFIIIFCETGLVVTPILPGDSLLFAAGTIAANSSLNIHLLFVLLFLASVLGNTTNYWIGRMAGPKIFFSRRSRFFNTEYLNKTHQFYEQHGGKTLLIARFLPIIRTFAPFVAGIGAMKQWEFFCFNIIGAGLWIGSLLTASYFFGNFAPIKDHFSLIIVGIIILSLLPAAIAFIRHRLFKVVRSSTAYF